MSKWQNKQVTINQGTRNPIRVRGWLSPSGRWHVRRATRTGDQWIVSHVPSGLAAMHLEGLLRSIKPALDKVDARLGELRHDEQRRDVARDMLAEHCIAMTRRFAP
jgi:hypothetical protein